MDLRLFATVFASVFVAELGDKVRSGEVVCVFSNGGFGGIHDKLLAKFGEKPVLETRR